MDSHNIIWFFIAALAAAIPIALIKVYTETKDMIWIVLSVISYCILIFAYSIVLSERNITIIYPILKVLSIILVILAGFLIFNNHLDMKSLFGILLGIASIYLLSDKIHNKG